MTREQLIHIIRASARITEESTFIVVGSQSILASQAELPAPLVVSMEADIYPKHNPDLAIEIDGGIGEGSMFQATLGIYAHSVGPETAKLPAGWEERLVPLVVVSDDREVVAECLEPHDLALAKCVAGRARDWEFVECALREGILDLEVMRERYTSLPVANKDVQRVGEILEAIAARL